MKIEIAETLPFATSLVWEALNNPAALDQWLMKNNFKPEVGLKFEFRAKPTVGWNGICEAEIKELTPPRRAVWIWDRNARHPWTITWTLERMLHDETRLTMTHEGFRGIGGFLLAKFIMKKGWNLMIRENLPIVLFYMQRNGTKFPESYLIPRRAKSG